MAAHQILALIVVGSNPRGGAMKYSKLALLTICHTCEYKYGSARIITEPEQEQQRHDFLKKHENCGESLNGPIS